MSFVILVNYWTQRSSWGFQICSQLIWSQGGPEDLQVCGWCLTWEQSCGGLFPQMVGLPFWRPLSLKLNLNSPKNPLNNYKISFFFRVYWILVVDTASKPFKIHCSFLGSQYTYLGQVLNQIWSKSIMKILFFVLPLILESPCSGHWPLNRFACLIRGCI